MSDVDKIVAALLVVARQSQNNASTKDLFNLRDDYYQALLLLSEGQGSSRRSSQ